MNEELQNALSEIINKALSGVDAAGDFLAGEIPEVIGQLLMWEAAQSLVFFGTGACLLIAFLMLLKMAKEGWSEDETGENFKSIFGTIAGFFTFIFSMVFLLANLEWLQIWIAPKVYLIEYAANLAH